MEDIAPGLLEALVEDYEKNKENSELIQLIKSKLEDGSATYADANDYAIELGDILAYAYAHNISSDILPDGRMYYNIADRVIRPTMVRSYDDISNATVKIQQSLNEKAGIGIKAIKPELNQDRIKGIVNKISNAEFYDDVAWVLDAPIKNYAQSIVDDSVKVNTEFHDKAGLTPKIIRKSAGGCCDWCVKQAGEYRYPDVPKDVYRRHNYCRCTVDYDPGTGKVQNVHSKQWKEADEELERRKTIGLSETSKEELERRKTIGLDVNYREESLRTKDGGTYGVNWKVIKSKEYTNRFNKISENQEANMLAAQRSRNALVNRDGKNTEEIYAIDLISGKDVSSITEQNYELGIKRTIKFNDDIIRCEKNGGKILFIHNHPNGFPPSETDLNELLNHNDAVGITIGHNGSIYYYTKPNKIIEKKDLDVAIMKNKKYNIITAYEKALEELSMKFEFEFKIL